MEFRPKEKEAMLNPFPTHSLFTSNFPRRFLPHMILNACLPFSLAQFSSEFMDVDEANWAQTPDASFTFLFLCLDFVGSPINGLCAHNLAWV